MCDPDAARSLTLALPYIFGSIGESTMYVFGAVNVISIPIGTSISPYHHRRC